MAVIVLNSIIKWHLQVNSKIGRRGHNKDRTTKIIGNVKMMEMRILIKRKKAIGKGKQR